MTDGKYVKSIEYDWFYCSGGQESTTLTTLPNTRDTVERIIYHEPKGEGDKHYADITFAGGQVKRVFNINSIDFFKKGEFKGD